MEIGDIKQNYIARHDNDGGHVFLLTQTLDPAGKVLGVDRELISSHPDFKTAQREAAKLNRN